MAENVHKFEPDAVMETLTAGGTITAGNVVYLSAAGTVSATTAASSAVLGSAASDATVGQKVGVLLGGVQRLVAAGAIAAGALVISAANGRVATIGAGTFDQVLGVAQTAAASAGDVIEVRVFR
jgi:hypothetical protein